MSWKARKALEGPWFQIVQKWLQNWDRVLMVDKFCIDEGHQFWNLLDLRSNTKDVIRNGIIKLNSRKCKILQIIIILITIITSVLLTNSTKWIVANLITDQFICAYVIVQYIMHSSFCQLLSFFKLLDCKLYFSISNCSSYDIHTAIYEHRQNANSFLHHKAIKAFLWFKFLSNLRNT